MHLSIKFLPKIIVPLCIQLVMLNTSRDFIMHSTMFYLSSHQHIRIHAQKNEKDTYIIHNHSEMDSPTYSIFAYLTLTYVSKLQEQTVHNIII